MAEREFIVREWRDEKGILHIKEVGQELVRCKECKHRGICFGKLVQGIEVVQLNFCSYGEREGE